MTLLYLPLFYLFLLLSRQTDSNFCGSFIITKDRVTGFRAFK